MTTIFRGKEVAEEFVQKQKEFEQKLAIGICEVCNKVYTPKFFNQDLCKECVKFLEVF